MTRDRVTLTPTQVTVMIETGIVLRKAEPATETVEQFLARGGTIRKITEYPVPEGRVVRRGHAGRTPRPAGTPSRPPSAEPPTGS